MLASSQLPTPSQVPHRSMHASSGTAPCLAAAPSSSRGHRRHRRRLQVNASLPFNHVHGPAPPPPPQQQQSCCRHHQHHPCACTAHRPAHRGSRCPPPARCGTRGGGSRRARCSRVGPLPSRLAPLAATATAGCGGAVTRWAVAADTAVATAATTVALMTLRRSLCRTHLLLLPPSSVVAVARVAPAAATATAAAAALSFCRRHAGGVIRELERLLLRGGTGQ